jgi:hypothetical protein
MATQRPTKRPATRQPRSASPRPQRTGETFIDRLVAIGHRIPDEELATLPRDLAKNFDHYAHGSPRED